MEYVVSQPVERGGKWYACGYVAAHNMRRVIWYFSFASKAAALEYGMAWLTNTAATSARGNAA